MKEMAEIQTKMQEINKYLKEQEWDKTVYCLHIIYSILFLKCKLEQLENKEILAILIRMEEIKLSLFADNVRVS